MFLFFSQFIRTMMTYLESTIRYILTVSYHIGRSVLGIFFYIYETLQKFVSICHIVADDFYEFLCDLETGINFLIDSSIHGVSQVSPLRININRLINDIKISTDQCVDKLIGDFHALFMEIRNAITLITEYMWYALTFIPRWLCYILLMTGNAIICLMTSLRQGMTSLMVIIVNNIMFVCSLLFLLIIFYTLWITRRTVLFYILTWTKTMKHGILKFSLRRIMPFTNISFEEIKKNPYNDQFCVVCHDRPKRVLILPCRHLCLCNDCARFILNTTGDIIHKQCPLCRSYIDETILVYF